MSLFYIFFTVYTDASLGTICERNVICELCLILKLIIIKGTLIMHILSIASSIAVRSTW